MSRRSSKDDRPLVEDMTTTDAGPDRSARRARIPSWLRAGAPTWIWIGIGIVVAGFVLIVIAWGQVAAETQVHLQLPYVVSAGLVGLGLIMIGIAVLNIATRERDAVERDRQIHRLVSILEELRDAFAERRGGRR